MNLFFYLENVVCTFCFLLLGTFFPIYAYSSNNEVAYVLFKGEPTNHNYNNWGVRSHNFSDLCDGYYKGHSGIDIQTKTKGQEPFYSLSTGIVVSTNVSGANGIAIYDDVSNVTAIYLHASSVFVKVGKPVKVGDKLGLQGCAGKCDGPHVHLEFRRGNYDFTKGKTVSAACGKTSTIDPIETAISYITNAKLTTTGSVAEEIILPGDSRYGWSLGLDGKVWFDGQFIITTPDPASSDLRFSSMSLNGVNRYVVLYDGDKGVVKGYVWRQDTGKIINEVPKIIEKPYLYSQVDARIFWSNDNTRAVVMQAGEVQHHIYILNLQSGKTTKHTIGPYGRNHCEFQTLDPVGWGDNRMFRLKVIIQTNFWDPCPDITERISIIDVPVE